MYQAKDAPAQYLAQPISYVYLTHFANVAFKIRNLSAVLINGEMVLWEVASFLLKQLQYHGQ